MKTLVTAAALALVLALPTSGLAHTGLAGTVPKNGSTLTQSPPVIELTFRGEARLTSVVVIDASKSERKLDFTPKGSATAFKVPNPELKPGHNEIRWKALSKDGHVSSGSLAVTIAPKTN